MARRDTLSTIAKLAFHCVLAGVLAAALMFPLAGAAGLSIARISSVVIEDSAQIVKGTVPTVTTMVDAAGNPIAWLYAQRRWEVPGDRIADAMKLAIVSIEDKRFTEHNGVDLQGTLTGLRGYLSGDEGARGGSTIEQQYVKNFNLLINAKTAAERAAAVETTPTRKLREMRMSLELDKVLSKPEILTRYLNLVSFGNGGYGVQDAARTYFGIDASQLNWQQAALLAGLVQSTSALNPYTNPAGALARRNLVLSTMIDNLPDKADELRAAAAQPLGVLPRPNVLPQGCIAAGNRAFFCDYALSYLAAAGLSREEVARNGYLIRTTLDPKVQDSVKRGVDAVASPTQDGVASVMSVIRPGKDAHRVVAMADNRTFGLDLAAGQTVQPQPYSMVGDGAGSIFKIFTTAAALEMGMGINAQLDVPETFRGTGLGSSNTPRVPADDLVRQERRRLPRHDERDRRAGAVAEHRLRQSDCASGCPAGSGHGGAARASVVRCAGHRPRLRPRQRRESCRLHQAAEHRILHARPIRAQRTRIVQCRRDIGVRWHVVPADAHRQGLRPARGRGGAQDRALRAGGPRRAGQYAFRRPWQGHHWRNGGGFGGFGGMESADVGKDGHHRISSVVGIPRIHQSIRRRQLRLRRFPEAVWALFVPAAKVRQRQPLWWRVASAHLVPWR